jgi:ribosomal protein S24E
MLQDMKKHREAEALYRRALAGRVEQLGAAHPLSLDTVKMLASLLRATKKGTAAKKLLKEYGVKGSQKKFSLFSARKREDQYRADPYDDFVAAPS